VEELRLVLPDEYPSEVVPTVLLLPAGLEYDVEEEPVLP